MRKRSYQNIEALLGSVELEEIREGLKLAKKEISRLGSNKAKPLFEMISTLFYIDPLDRPELVPLLNEAVTLVSRFRKWVIPFLIKNLEAGDVKAQMAVAHALGRMGAKAIEPLIKEYKKLSNPANRSFILYALGKINSPEIIKAAQIAIKEAKSTDIELRDTATRAIGKFVESIPPKKLPKKILRSFIERLKKNLGDENPGIRAKAVRSLGKLAKYGHLSLKEREELKATLELILGVDGQYDWDRAYVVRKEAKEALNYVEPNSKQN